MRYYDVIGTPLCATSYQEFVTHCQSESKKDRVFAVDFTNTHIVTMRRMQRDFRAMTSVVDYFVPDGMPLVWCLNRCGAGLKDRVYGPRFMRECVLASVAPFSHYFLGGSPECLSRLEAGFLRNEPRLRIVGRHHGYLAGSEEEAIVSDINEKAPDFIWVGLGTPRQQAWIRKWKCGIKRGALMAVGFAFDVNAGTKPDAPRWMQRRGMGWVYRCLSEPRRLGARYLRYNSLFLFYLVWDGLRGRALAPLGSREEGRGKARGAKGRLEVP